jgi:hypothetical protein
MSIVRMISSGLGAVTRNNSVRQGGNYLAKGATGIMTAGGYGLSSASGYYTYGQDYGAGAGTLMGLGEALAVDLAIKGLGFGGAAIVGIPTAIGYLAYKQGRETFDQNRRVSMSRLMVDQYGTLREMGMRSISNLARDRSGYQRTIGNEARMFHR